MEGRLIPHFPATFCAKLTRPENRYLADQPARLGFLPAVSLSN